MRNVSIDILKATNSDLEDILQLFVNTINLICLKDYSPEQLKAWTAGAHDTERWSKKLQTQYFLLAKHQNELVGFASLEKSHIDYLFVHHDFQGKGVATKLIEKLEEMARIESRQIITSDVSLTAQPFFKRMGFETLKRNTVNIRGSNLSNFSMQKMLT